jgi:hypothetical protein
MQKYDMDQYEKCHTKEVDSGFFCSVCPEGHEPGSGFHRDSSYSNVYCGSACPIGYKGDGVSCTQACPEGWADNGIGCTKPKACIGHATKSKTPTPLECPSDREGVREQAGSCVTGVFNIVPGYDLVSRLRKGTCPVDVVDGKEVEYELVSSRCYEKCKEGYARTPGGGLLCMPTTCPPGYKKFGCCTCTPVCPEGMKDVGISCIKDTKPRSYVPAKLRKKERIVPYSTKIVKPITEIIDYKEPVPLVCSSTEVYNPKTKSCESTVCEDGKVYNYASGYCTVPCPEPGQDRFDSKCYAACNKLAADKGYQHLLDQGVNFIPSPGNPMTCVPECPDGYILANDKCVSCEPGYSYYPKLEKCVPDPPKGYKDAGVNEDHSYMACVQAPISRTRATIVNVDRGACPPGYNYHHPDKCIKCGDPEEDLVGEICVKCEKGYHYGRSVMGADACIPDT